MLKATQHLLAITALLFGCAIGPDTHVHPGEGPHSDTLIHAHAGMVGHVHASRTGLSSAGEGPASYINAFSLTSTHGVQLPVPVTISKVRILPSPSIYVDHFSALDLTRAHAPPGVERGHLRAPPNYLSA